MKKKFLSVLIFALVQLSCSRDESPAAAPVVVSEPTEEIGYYSLLASILPNTTIQEYNWDPALSLEVGYAFTPKVNGKITAIEVKLPFVHGLTDVHIWDGNTGALLRTETLNMVLAHTIIKKNISGISLQANKKYLISVETNYWYRYAKTDPNKITWPYSNGNIQYNYAASSGRDLIPERNLTDTYFEGDVAFTFLRTQ